MNHETRPAAIPLSVAALLALTLLLQGAADTPAHVFGDGTTVADAQPTAGAVLPARTGSPWTGSPRTGSLWTGATGSALPGSPSPAAAPPEAPPPAPASAESRPDRPTESSSNASSGDRRRRWRRRNIYRGPIPTPEDWEPPTGPIRIGLQAGHWRADEAPSELSGLRGNGTRWGELAEWEANLAIARRAAAMLEELGYVVDILPAVVPPGYRSHLFVAIHADGSGDPDASGYRVASPRRDATGRADAIEALLGRSYGDATGLPRIPAATRRMRNYYAFNFRRYRHALHPMTIAVILETGFLTSERDRRVILDDPDKPARGIVEAIRKFPVTAMPEVAATPAPSAPSARLAPTAPATTRALALEPLAPEPLALEPPVSGPPPSGPARPGARRPGS